MPRPSAMTRTGAADDSKDLPSSWLPMAVVALGQTLTTLNISALPLLIGAMVDEFGIAPTSVAGTIVVYSIAVSGFIMLGAKLGQKYGATALYRWATALLLAAAALTTLSASIGWLLLAQALSGLGAALMLPTLVVLITENYSGAQQTKAIGLLGGVQAAATVLTILVAGYAGTHLGWRYSFGIIIPCAIVALALSRGLEPSGKSPGLRIDVVGAALVALAIGLLSAGFGLANAWGLVRATALAPASLFGLSPALPMLLAGLFGMQLFMVWMQRRRALALDPLLAIEVMESRRERAAVLALMAIVAIGSAINFTIPLYMQMVQEHSSLETALALIPYHLSVLAAAIAVIGLYRRFSPRQLARYSFMLVSLALVALAATVRNQWNDVLVVISLVAIGTGQGALATLLFNVLISAVPKTQAGDVGALRGAARNLANGLGAALAGALVVSLLAASIGQEIRDHPEIPASLIAQVNIDRATFLSNEQLQDILANTTASPRQVAEALKVNAEARLYALKMTFLLLAAAALLMVVPVRRLPGFNRAMRNGTGPAG